MPNLVDPACGPATLEALPRLTGRRRAIGSSVGEPPRDDEELMAGSWEFSANRPRLSRVLTGVRVLVVDDDEDTADLFAAALTACGADVVTATTASDALRVIAARAPDVVVTDIAMPGADGYWLIREIRSWRTPLRGPYLWWRSPPSGASTSALGRWRQASSITSRNQWTPRRCAWL
jgi:CheY-like chemotaxis protein